MAFSFMAEFGARPWIMTDVGLAAGENVGSTGKQRRRNQKMFRAQIPIPGGLSWDCPLVPCVYKSQSANVILWNS